MLRAHPPTRLERAHTPRTRYAHRLLRDKAARGAFLPFTNTEQDVLETVFAPANLSAPKLPRHFHSSYHDPGWDGRCDDERARSRVRGALIT